MLGESQYNVVMCVPRGNSRSCHRGDLIAVSIVGHAVSGREQIRPAREPMELPRRETYHFEGEGGGFMRGLMGVGGLGQWRGVRLI